MVLWKSVRWLIVILFYMDKKLLRKILLNSENYSLFLQVENVLDCLFTEIKFFCNLAAGVFTFHFFVAVKFGITLSYKKIP